MISASPADIIIIGAGPGGYRAAEYAAEQGLKVVIIEQAEVGGTCLNVGCIPTKAYVHSTSFAEARERMATVVPLLRQGVETILSHPNITLVRDRASLVDTHTVACSACGDTITARNIIIATGSETKWLPIKGKDDPLDSDIAKRLRKYLEKQGINFKMKTAVEDIADIDADVILMATGRKPRTEGLGLETLGIMFEKNGAIPVDDNFHVISGSLTDGQSVVPQSDADIYAIGDANGLQMLAHAAEMQAIRAMNHIIGKKDNIRFDIMPAAIFTEPEAACVGPTEDQLKAASVASSLPADYTCHKAFWRANGKALTMNETEGMLKLFSAADGRILGCHAYGAHSADIVQEVSVLMCRDTTIQQLRDMVHIHPTLSEILLSAVG